ncbi:MAG: peptidoglycan DD-metalloendopeptidase family protein [Rhodoglobus sp.]
MSPDAAYPQQPEVGEQIPLTRKQLRERERAAERGNAQHSSQHSKQSVEAPAAPVLAELFVPAPAEPTAIDSPARVDIDAVMPTRRSQRDFVAQPVEAASAPRARKAQRTTVRSKRIRVSPAAFTAEVGPRGGRKSFAAHALSSGAMLFAAALLVGVSVPSNAFLSSDSVATIAAPQPEVANLAADSRPTQSLAVSDEVIGEVAEHDSLDVISYAEVLALKHAGVSYEYRATAGAIRWPFPYAIPITDGFGDRVGGFHKGTDFAAAQGTPIYAIASGVVSYIQSDYTGYGYNAIISHVVNGQQVQTQYAHMVSGSSPLVVGDPISVGDFVGLVGQTGRSYGAHLHLEIHLDKVPVDPYAWLTKNAVN